MTPTTCERCDYTGHDVRVRLVRHQSEGERRSEPSRIWYATEARCQDERACDGRVAVKP